MTAKEFTVEIEMRFADLDAYGHVNNATYFTYLETARTKIFLQNFIDFMNEGISFVVARAECDFKKPINFGDRVMITLTINRGGRTSFEVDYKIQDPEGKLFANAKTVMVAIDEAKQSPTALPEKFFSMIEA